MSLPLPHRYLKQRYEISKHKNPEVPLMAVREAMTGNNLEQELNVYLRKLRKEQTKNKVSPSVSAWIKHIILCGL